MLSNAWCDVLYVCASCGACCVLDSQCLQCAVFPWCRLVCRTFASVLLPVMVR
jgi:hypothetical protein